MKTQHTAQSLDKPKMSISESSVRALESLLDDRYSQKYPFPKNLRHPASDPGHYDKIVQEFEEAPNRSWIGRLIKRFSGAIRIQ
jgi:cytochrome b pre-mRNA-processing protein 6